MLGIELRTSCLVGKHSTTESHPQSMTSLLKLSPKGQLSCPSPKQRFAHHRPDFCLDPSVINDGASVYFP